MAISFSEGKGAGFKEMRLLSQAMWLHTTSNSQFQRQE
jgi:hypothetical protein